MPDPAPKTLAELIHEDNIIINPASEERQSVIKALVQNMVATGLVVKTQASTVSRLINEREALGSTALGGGVAIPHARIGFAKRPLLAFARLRNGQGFNSLDGASVHFVFLALTPKDDDDAHRAVLQAITSFVRQAVHRKALSGCLTPADVKSVFIDYA
ncbi:MAG: PTS sugar transporter subunit IIA [Planctomycetota bacterium]|jgi:mannitol/fructose-specific phosphotransferase system IIA component (Ntr-type)|nr:PTS sugar transporter subunit IIA [Planctomycetota bacterium]